VATAGSAECCRGRGDPAGARRMFAKPFHVEIDAPGPVQLNRRVPLAPSKVQALKALNERAGRLR
jgi:hypothetical protein